MGRKHKTLFLILLVSVLIGAGWVLGLNPDQKSLILAQTDGLEISAESFRTRYVNYLLKSGVQDKPSLRKAFLEDRIATQLLINETRSEGIEQQENYLFRLEVVRRKLLVDAFVDNVLFDTLEVSEAEVREMFVRTQTQIKARHLYARTRDEANTLLDRLLRGESFEKLAQEVFSEPKLANNGGSLGYIGFDEFDPEFEDAAFSLEIGEISKPIRTAYGYSIIQLEDRFTKPLITEFEYAKRRSNLRAYVLDRKQKRARRFHARFLVEQLNLEFDEVALGRLLDQITGENVFETVEEFESLASDPLVSFGSSFERSSWTIGEFREQALYTSEGQRAQVRSRADLIEFVQGLVVRQKMMDQSRDQNLDLSPDYRRAEAEAMDEFVLDRVRVGLSSEVDVPEDSIRSYFDSAPPTEFIRPEQIHLREILLATESEAGQMKLKLAQTPFEVLARRFTIRPGGRDSGGDLGYLTPEQLGPIRELLIEASVTDIVGPIELKGRYGFYRVEDRTDARPMTYDESRNQISEMLHFQYRRNHRREVYNDIRSRYEVIVDTDLLYSMSLAGEKNT